MPRSMVLIVLSALSFLVLIAGGIFIYSRWQTALYYPEDLKEQSKTESEKPKNDDGASPETVKESSYERSRRAKGIYMNAFIANSKDSQAVAVRNEINSLLDATELNAVVIDVKESYGTYMPSSLKDYIKELKEKNVWVIARICAFRDSSLLDGYPEWYVKTKTATGSLEFWKDSGGGYWLDPKSPDVQNYIINFSKRAVDFGFDELQFDYIRFPSDGDVENTVYPYYDKEQEEKYRVIGDFFSKTSQSLKNYKADIILSVDLFGYVAAHRNATEIGQRTYDAAQYFDYISYMLYPSHFYAGLQVGSDEKRGLPSMYLPYKSEEPAKVVSNNPYATVARSIFIASDYLSSIGSKAKIRPWLQDFDLKADTDRDIYYDAVKVKDEILAAEESGASGWLLWRPSGEYTKGALREE